MISRKQRYQVAIAGGGPVGLFLGCCLESAGISSVILEKREERISHSRSIGIHPVSLQMFNKIGLADPFVDHGIKIRKGHAYTGTRKLGSILFEKLPRPFNFILSLPQFKTEELLENRVHQLNSGMLLRGTEVTDIEERERGIHITYLRQDARHSITCDFLAGCDGKDSFVRKKTGLSFNETPYPDTYIMGDFSDNTNLGSDAAVFLPPDGLIESFPLSGSFRRWVVKTDNYVPEVSRKDIERRLAERIGHDLSQEENVMLSSFGVQKAVSESFIKGRSILVGDAAHVVSPIGGQGMNLGWMDAWDLALTLKEALHQNRQDQKQKLNAFAKRRMRISRKVMRRAELNMRLGRKSSFPAIRNTLVWIMLNTPLSKVMSGLFSMKGLERWPF